MHLGFVYCKVKLRLHFLEGIMELFWKNVWRFLKIHQNFTDHLQPQAWHDCVSVEDNQCSLTASRQNTSILEFCFFACLVWQLIRCVLWLLPTGAPSRQQETWHSEWGITFISLQWTCNHLTTGALYQLKSQLWMSAHVYAAPCDCEGKGQRNVLTSKYGRSQSIRSW